MGGNNYFYDLNGNTQSGDGTRTYKWDAENRLVEIDYVGSNAKTQFAYDGLGRRTVGIETASGGGTTTDRYLWCDAGRVCQTRDGGDNVIRRIMVEGELDVTTGQKLIYMPDQLGSVGDVLDGTTDGLVAAYEYTPYGSIAGSYGTTRIDYRYAGLFYHGASTLNLATYRQLDGVTGRFLNRDPIRESGGINLYDYTRSNPINRIDPLGLCPDPNRCKNIKSAGEYTAALGGVSFAVGFDVDFTIFGLPGGLLLNAYGGYLGGVGAAMIIYGGLFCH